MPQALRHVGLLLAVGGTVFFINLGVPHLWDVDEAIFTQAAREMMDRNDLVVPWFNGHLFPDKPVLMYWLMISAFKVFGTTEFAARFWSAVLGLGSLLLTYGLGRRLFSPKVGLWAGLILATNLNFDIIVRAATPDSILVFFTTLALCCFAVDYWPRRATALDSNHGIKPSTTDRWRRRPRWHTALAAYAAMAVGLLAKGPIGLLMPAMVWGLFLMIMRRPAEPLSPNGDRTHGWRRKLIFAFRTFGPWAFVRAAWQMRPITGLLAIVLVAGPWYALVTLRTGGRWPTEFFGVHNVSRFLHPMDGHRGSIFYYLVAIAIGFFPWSVFLAPTVSELRRRIRQRDSLSPGAILLACWVGVWLVFFSLSSTKLPNYVVPTFPALALATACFVERLLTQPQSVARVWQRLAWGTVALAGLGAVIAIPIVVSTLFDGDPRLALIGMPLFVGGSLGLIYVELGEARRAVNTLLLSSIALALCVFGYGAVRVDQYQNSPLFASVISANSVAGETHIGSYRYFRPSLVFYTHHNIVRLDDGAPLVREFFEKNPRNAFLVACEDRWDELQSVLPSDVSILVSSRGFLRKQEIILLGRATEGPPPVASGPGATLK